MTQTLYRMQDNIRVLFIFGTRPEAIKCAPLVREMQADDRFAVKVCVTAQHRSMLDQVMDFFELKADYDLDVMAPNQTLSGLVARVMPGLDEVIADCSPHLIIVQGDTTTSFLGALSGYYHKIHIAHLEAGLRSGDKYAPWPEEGNRLMVSHLANLHFAPTVGARTNLANENLHNHVYVTGNTVIDALFLAISLIESDDKDLQVRFADLPTDRKFILVTAHRRESFGEPFEQMCLAMREIAERHPDVHLIYPVHLNPNVREPVHRLLSGIDNISLIDPIDYREMVWLMQRSVLILTDSGGVQEEAPALGKPVLVMRTVTERQEGVDAGTAILVGTDRKLIVDSVDALLTDKTLYEAMSQAVNPYGDGTASKQIVGIVLQYFGKSI